MRAPLLDEICLPLDNIVEALQAAGLFQTKIDDSTLARGVHESFP